MQFDYREFHINASPLDEGGRYYARAKIYRRASATGAPWLWLPSPDRSMTERSAAIGVWASCLRANRKAPLIEVAPP